MNLNTYPELMTVEEMAEYLRTSTRTILNWASRGEIPAGKIGSEWRFRRDDVSAWVEVQFRPESSATQLTDLKDVLKRENVLILHDSNKADVLTALVNHLSKLPEVKDSNATLKAIFQREELMSTGIGMGLAVPHVRIPAISDLAVGLALVPNGIEDYESIDSLPVRLVVMILAREDQHGEHLRTLSLFSQKLKGDKLRSKVFAAKNDSDLYDRLV